MIFSRNKGFLRLCFISITIFIIYGNRYFVNVISRLQVKYFKVKSIHLYAKQSSLKKAPIIQMRVEALDW